MRTLRACAVKISLHRARDAMGKGLEPLTGQLRILRRLLRLVDPDYARLVEESAPLPYWAISSLMTLYTHDLPTLVLAQRVMDWILCRPPDAVIYLVAAVSSPLFSQYAINRPNSESLFQFTLEKKKDIQQLIDEGDDGMMHSELCALPELEADELEPEPEVKVVAAPMADPPAYDTLVPTVPSLVNDLAPLHSTTDTPDTSNQISPSNSTQKLTEKEGFGETSHAVTTSAEKSEPLPPSSPASSLSSLPLQPPSSNHPHSLAIPLSSILQKADRLRSRFPINHEYLHLEETMGPKSMLRTWSRDPKEILSDEAAEEAVLSTEELVLPEQEEDEDFPYLPIEPKRPDTRLALLPKIDIGMAFAIGLPMAAAMFMVASNSPTAKARTEQFAALAFNFVEVGMF